MFSGTIDLQSAANRATDFNVGKRQERRQQKNKKYNHLNVCFVFEVGKIIRF